MTTLHIPRVRNIRPLLGVSAVLDIEREAIIFGVPVGSPIDRTVADVARRGVLSSVYPSSRTTPNALAARLYRLINDDVVLAAQGLPSSETERGVKFDVTLLPSSVGASSAHPRELPKTIGHYHLPVPGYELPTPDFYQVAHGTGSLLLQHVIGSSVRAYRVDVAAGDTVLIPPHLGHIAINTGSEPLVFANVCVRRPHLDYRHFEALRGGSYYFVSGPGGSVDTIANPAYLDAGLTVLPLRRAFSHLRGLAKLGVSAESPIYAYIIRRSPIIRALCEPDEYRAVFLAALSLGSQMDREDDASDGPFNR